MSTVMYKSREIARAARLGVLVFARVNYCDLPSLFSTQPCQIDPAPLTTLQNYLFYDQIVIKRLHLGIIAQCTVCGRLCIIALMRLRGAIINSWLSYRS